MSNMNRSNNNECRIYVGNLPQDVRESDLENIFYKYGKVAYIDLKKRGPGPPYSFIEFEDRRDAEDAVYGRSGYEFDGCKLRVEFPRSGRSGGGGGDRDYNDRDRFSGGGGGGGGGGGRGVFSGGGRRPFTARRSDYRVLVSGLPASGSWQDLKDHMREAGDVLFTDVFRDGTGIVEYAKYDDMKFAVKNLDDTKFRSHEGEIAYVRVKEDRSGGNSRSRSRSYSPRRRSRSRSNGSQRKRSYSPRRSYSPKRSASRSPRRSQSRSRSRSRSRS